MAAGHQEAVGGIAMRKGVFGEQGNLPGADGAQQNRAARTPAFVDLAPGLLLQAGITGIHPQGDMCVEKKRNAQCAISRPDWASGTTSRTRPRRSTPSLTSTDPT